MVLFYHEFQIIKKSGENPPCRSCDLFRVSVNIPCCTRCQYSRERRRRYQPLERSSQNVWLPRKPLTRQRVDPPSEVSRGVTSSNSVASGGKIRFPAVEGPREQLSVIIIVYSTKHLYFFFNESERGEDFTKKGVRRLNQIKQLTWLNTILLNLMGGCTSHFNIMISSLVASRY